MTIAAVQAAMGATPDKESKKPSAYTGQELMRPGKGKSFTEMIKSNPVPEAEWYTCGRCHKGDLNKLKRDIEHNHAASQVVYVVTGTPIKDEPVSKKAKTAVAKKTPVKKADKKIATKKAVSEAPKRSAKKAIASATAGGYTVRKGDSLSKITARLGITDWKILYYVNQDIVGNNPDRVFPGQKLRLPDKDIYYWVNEGWDPYGNKGLKEAVNSFKRLPDPVKEVSYLLMKDAPGEDGFIAPGERLDEMHFGSGLAHDVVNATGKPIATKVWTIEYKDNLYTFYKPGCTNWSYKAEKRYPSEVKAAPPAAKPEEKVEEPTKPLVSIPEKEPAEEVAPPVQEELAVMQKAPEEPKTDYDLAIFAGRYKLTDAETEGNFSYYGIDGTLFLVNHFDDGEWKLGPSFQLTGWNGKADGAGFKGKKGLIGAEVQHITDNHKTSFKLRLGGKDGEVSAVGGLYRAEESNRILNLEAYRQWWWKRKWFSGFLAGARADIDISGDKSSSFNGVPISSADDPRRDQSEYAVWGQADIYKVNGLTAFLIGAGGYRGFDENLFLEPGVGVKLFHESVEAKASYQIIEGAENNAAGVGLVINIDNLYDNLRDYLRNTKQP